MCRSSASRIAELICWVPSAPAPRGQCSTVAGAPVSLGVPWGDGAAASCSAQCPLSHFGPVTPGEGFAPVQWLLTVRRIPQQGGVGGIATFWGALFGSDRAETLRLYSASAVGS